MLPLDELFGVIRWLFWSWALAVLCLPLAARIVPDHRDGGYVVARILGGTLAPFIAWYLASLSLVSFSENGPAATILVLAALAFMCRGIVLPPPIRILRIEAAFLGLFVLGLAVRLLVPDLAGLEKFMDHGLLAAAMRAETMPPTDMWFAGEAINYYYFGHASIAFLGRLSTVPSDHAYQLGMATLFAVSGLGVHQLVSELTRRHGARLSQVIAWTVTAVVLYGGNFHSVLYSLFRARMTEDTDAFYFPDSTRFIGFDPETKDKGFTEFLSYGFRVGDMHAHILSTPVFILGLILVLSILRHLWTTSRFDPRQSLAVGWVLGLAYITNSWDLAILGLVTLLAAILIAARHWRGGWALVDRFGAQAVLVLAVTVLTLAPFQSGFHVFAEDIRLTQSRTPLWQLAVLYGHALPALVAAPMLLVLKPPAQNVETAFVFVISISAVLLIAIPEVVYVKDIYSADFARANTMFKLTFRAQLLLPIAALTIAATLLAGSAMRAMIGLVVALPVVATLVFAADTFADPRKIQALNGFGFLGEEEPIVRALAKTSARSDQVIAEAAGISYTNDSRFSAMTGIPTVLGWENHEWLWRSDRRSAATRILALGALYEAKDVAQACGTVALYRITHIVVGASERKRYPLLNQAVLNEISRPAFESPGTRIFAMRPGACVP